MASEELLSSFNELLEEYEKHRHYIERAKAQAQKFSSSVVEKVILDHEIHSSEVADKVLPLVPELEGAIAAIDEEKGEIQISTSAAATQIEELELRQLIGELTDEEFENLSKELKDTVEKAAERVAELDGEREVLTGAIERWTTAATEAGQDPGTSEAVAEEEPEEAAEEEPEEAAEEEPEEAAEEEDAEEEGDSYSLPEIADEPVVEDASNVHASLDVGAVDDVSDLFSDEPSGAAVAIAVGGDNEELIDMGDADGEDVGDQPSADVDFGFDEDQGGVEFMEGGADAEVEFDLEAEGGGSEDEIGVDLDEDEVVEADGPSAEEDARRALLLYQEGTAEEQIYPFTGEVLSIGRGRDNDIQIKNDSKVSRFHCKLFRRGNNFYIEDNKSSNGTLVNGELITERRLFGGEEIIIGETFFRFRIM